eukprot:TRINITY_DN67780_c0_g1_i5.p1 TRINITY_DN67780_c0_g1~~TRINITY_DN67780_c0_g1_i5.p1  ORF type:complete len:362 (-),score=39.84 TRINITY_DN67780_c0_g1_i5:200-1174(-)
MLFIPIIIVCAIILLEPLRTFVVMKIVAFLPSLLTVAFLISLSQKIIVSYWLTKGSFIRHYRIYTIAELFFTFFNLFKGVFVALVRIVMAILFFGVTFMRADISLLPLESEHRDPVNLAYNGMLMLDIQNNHPIKRVFIRLLTNSLKRRRDLKTLVSERLPMLRSFHKKFADESIAEWRKMRVIQELHDLGSDMSASMVSTMGSSYSGPTSSSDPNVKVMTSNPLLMGRLVANSNSRSRVYAPRGIEVDMFAISCEKLQQTIKDGSNCGKPWTEMKNVSENEVMYDVNVDFPKVGITHLYVYFGCFQDRHCNRKTSVYTHKYCS